MEQWRFVRGRWTGPEPPTEHVDAAYTFDALHTYERQVVRVVLAGGSSRSLSLNAARAVLRRFRFAHELPAKILVSDAGIFPPPPS